MAQQRAIFPRDRGLQFRMLLTLFLLGVLYVVFIGVLAAVGAGAVVTLVFIVGLLGAQFFLSDKLGAGGDGRQGGHPRGGPRASTR